MGGAFLLAKSTRMKLMRTVLSERQGGIALDSFPALCLVAAVGVDTFMGARKCFGNDNDHVCHVC